MLACYLALCLAFAGLVGVNPALHRLVEHGGQGPAHTHPRGLAHTVPDAGWHDHGDGQAHRHAAPDLPARSLFSHKYTPTGEPLLSLRGLWGALKAVAGTSPSSNQPQPAGDEGHHHHSLAQLLASGLIDQHLDAPVLTGPPISFVVVCCFADSPLLIPDWDAQSASRGPPTSQS